MGADSFVVLLRTRVQPTPLTPSSQAQSQASQSRESDARTHAPPRGGGKKQWGVLFSIDSLTSVKMTPLTGLTCLTVAW